MAGLDLSESPFHVPGVSPRFDAASISQAAEEAISSGCVGEADARAAERTLMDSESRLIAERGWLPGVPPPDVASVRALLDDPDDVYDGDMRRHVRRLGRMP